MGSVRLRRWAIRALLVAPFAGLAPSTLGCIPIPTPSSVSVDEPSSIEPVEINPPGSSEVLSCVGRHLLEERPDVRIGEAESIWRRLDVESRQHMSTETMPTDERACEAMEAGQVDYLITVQHVRSAGRKQGGINAVVYGMPHGQGVQGPRRGSRARDSGVGRRGHHGRGLVRGGPTARRGSECLAGGLVERLVRSRKDP